jgi:hypothetical protein
MRRDELEISILGVDALTVSCVRGPTELAKSYPLVSLESSPFLSPPSNTSSTSMRNFSAFLATPPEDACVASEAVK